MPIRGTKGPKGSENVARSPDDGTHDQHGGADDAERQESADIHQLGEHSERQECSQKSHQASRQMVVFQGVQR